MRQLKISILSLALLAGSFISATAQTADEIIQKHIAAIGGADNWKKIKTIKLTGSTTAQGMEIPINIAILQDKGFKVDMSINGMTGYTIMTDKDGWNYYPFGGQTKPEAMPEEAVKQAKDGLDIQGPLIDYQAKGNKITYLGKDEVEGTECYKLKVTYPTGKEETVYIDAANYYHIQSKSKITANGKEMEQTANYSNFQKLPEGIMYAMTIDQGMGAMNIKKVEINQPIPESFFKPSEAGK